VPMIEPIRAHAGCFGGPVRHQDLADRTLRREVGGDVDRVAQSREVTRVVRSDHPDERRTRVHARTDRDPGPLRRAVARDTEQLLSGSDRARSVLGPGQERDEQSDDLVADELLDDRVTLDQDPARLAVEAIHQPREIDHRHLPSELARASDVGEQHRDLDLSPAYLLTVGSAGAHLGVVPEALEAAPTDLRLLDPWRVSISSED